MVESLYFNYRKSGNSLSLKLSSSSFIKLANLMRLLVKRNGAFWAFNASGKNWSTIITNRPIWLYLLFWSKIHEGNFANSCSSNFILILTVFIATICHITTFQTIFFVHLWCNVIWVKLLFNSIRKTIICKNVPFGNRRWRL